MAPPVTLARLLQRVLDEQFGGQFKGLANAIGLDPAHTARLSRGEGTVSVETALRIADVCDLDPQAVLNACGKAETAERLTRLYGKAAPVRAARTAELRTWEGLLAELDPQTKAALLLLATRAAR